MNGLVDLINKINIHNDNENVLKQIKLIEMCNGDIKRSKINDRSVGSGDVQRRGVGGIKGSCAGLDRRALRQSESRCQDQGINRYKEGNNT